MIENKKKDKYTNHYIYIYKMLEKIIFYKHIFQYHIFPKKSNFNEFYYDENGGGFHLTVLREH